MKKINCFIIIFLLILYIPIVFAYDSTNYKIQIPKEYIKEKNKDVWVFKKDHITTISIQLINNISNIDINEMDGESIKEEKIIKQLNKNLTDKELDIKSSGVSLVKVNDYKAIKIDIDSTLTNQEYNSKIFQTQYILSSKNYLYYLVISSSNKDQLSSKKTNEIINSFTIKDELEANKEEEIKKYYIALSAIVVSSIILIFVKRKK